MSSANGFGQIFRVTSFGESHGTALGCVIEGCPAGVEISTATIQTALNRRRPGQAPWVSARGEKDDVEILSGIFEGRSLGTPIAAIVRNNDAKSEDYAGIEVALKLGGNPRIGHSDDVWRSKFGHSDVRGGGRSSGRETLARVIAGAIAREVVRAISPRTRVLAFASAIGTETLTTGERSDFLRSANESKDVESLTDTFTARFPSKSRGSKIEELLVSAVKEGRSYGGKAELSVLLPPKGLGQPVFHKLKADLAAAYFGVGATAGVDFGAGFNSADKEGTAFHNSTVGVESVYGGIRGGISTGEPIVAHVAFKPTSTVMDLAKKGRHDPCIVPRALPVLEAMTWLVICDHLLWARLDKI